MERPNGLYWHVTKTSDWPYVFAHSLPIMQFAQRLGMPICSESAYQIDMKAQLFAFHYISGYFLIWWALNVARRVIDSSVTINGPDFSLAPPGKYETVLGG